MNFYNISDLKYITLENLIDLASNNKISLQYSNELTKNIALLQKTNNTYTIFINIFDKQNYNWLKILILKWLLLISEIENKNIILKNNNNIKYNWNCFSNDILTSEENKIREKTKELLMPKNIIKKEYAKLLIKNTYKITSIRQMAIIFDMSEDFVLLRLNELNY